MTKRDRAAPTDLERLGPYRLLRKLGSGAMGTVYLAEEDGERVAVKILHPHLLERRGFFKRFRREARAGQRVRHANVVRTLDSDLLVVDGATCCLLVMEYVEGRTLRQLLRELGPVPETLLREVARQIAAGLSAIHAKGIVHRDLKPDNVLITADHEVRIMDLGIAKVEETAVALTREGQFAGSISYASPEQIQRREVGPPADLYSVGVMLHELATGDNPFRSDDPGATVHAHLTTVPPRVREREPDVSTFFSEVVATLLAKDPKERFASACDLQAVLEDAERSSWWRERQLRLRAAETRLPRIPVRRETKLYGRESERELLRRHWERARAGEGGTLLLVGEAGIGKTRLVDAFLREMEGEEAHILYGSYPPAGGMGGISDAILAKFGAEDLEQALGPYLKTTPSLVAPFAAIVKHETPSPDAPSLAGDALHAVCVHLMRALAAERPLLWILEDLHFADSGGRKVMQSLARAVEGHRILLLMTTRPGLPEEDLAHFTRLETCRSATVGRLSAREVVLLLQDAFRSVALADKLGARIALKSDGVPFFVFEMIRGLKEGQFISELPDGTYVESKVIEAIEVPSAVQDLIEARLRDLSDEDRAILDIGAVQGFEFDPDLVAMVRGSTRLALLERLAVVERRSGVVRAADQRYRFDHHQIQEVLYGRLPAGLKAEYHALLAEAYADRCSGDLKGDDAVFLAHHHVRGSRPRSALPHLEPALEHLENVFHNDALLDLARMALEAEGLLERRTRVDVLLHQASGLDRVGRRAEERAALDEALALADEYGTEVLRARVLGSLGDHFDRTSQNEAAHATLQEALQLAQVAGDRRTEGTITADLAVHFTNMGRYAEALKHMERACALLRDVAYRRYEARANLNLGRVFARMGRHAEAQELCERSRAISGEIGDRRTEGLATLNLGVVFSRLGHFTEAQECWERSLAIGREIGDRYTEAVSGCNLGTLCYVLGRYAEAQERCERNLALRREIGDRLGEAIVAVNLGYALANLGRPAQARVHCERSLAISREIGNHWIEANALTALADVADQQEDVERASRLYENALAHLRRLNEKEGLVRALGGLAQVEAARNAAESARTHLDEALALALETQVPDLILASVVERARLPGGDIEAALAALEEHGERVPHASKMEACFRLWELTQDKAHLTEAYRLLAYVQRMVPEDRRESLIENVPLHRDIMKAWEEHGEKDA